MDLVALAQNGITERRGPPWARRFRPEHFEKLYRNTSEVVCCFDGDRAGRQAAWRALEASLPSLRAGRQCKFVLLPDGEDPDSLVRSEGRMSLEQRIEGSTAAGDYLVEELSKGLDLGSMDRAHDCGNTAKPLSTASKRRGERLAGGAPLRHRGSQSRYAFDPPSRTGGSPG